MYTFLALAVFKQLHGAKGCGTTEHLVRELWSVLGLDLLVGIVRVV
jgi:hypothetical protein